jgi:hypothetical protein
MSSHRVFVQFVTERSGNTINAYIESKFGNQRLGYTCVTVGLPNQGWSRNIQPFMFAFREVIKYSHLR